MANQFNLPKDKELASKVLDNHNDIEKQKMSQGFLGKLWGDSSSIPNNIAALSVFVLLFTGIIYTCAAMRVSQDKIALSIKDFWAIISPLITLSIGYLFGDKRASSES